MQCRVDCNLELVGCGCNPGSISPTTPTYHLPLFSLSPVQALDLVKEAGLHGGGEGIFGGGARGGGIRAAERILRLLRESCTAACLLTVVDGRGMDAAGRLPTLTPAA